MMRGLPSGERSSFDGERQCFRIGAGAEGRVAPRHLDGPRLTKGMTLLSSALLDELASA
jgi:hypothetical protein